MRAYRLETPPLDAAAQMAADEAVLESAGPDACFLRIYRWDGPIPHGVTFGFSQRWEDALAAVRQRYPAVTFPVVRRVTGGGVVFHDGDLTFSFVFPWERLIGPLALYKSIHRGVMAGLRGVGVQSGLWEPAAKPPAALQEQCFSSPAPMDLTLADGEKILGGALRRRRGIGLYQGSLRPERLGLPREALERGVEEGLSLQWRTLFEPCPLAPATSAAVERLARERYGRDDWNRRR